MSLTTKAVPHVNSPFQRVCGSVRGWSTLSEFIKSKEQLMEPVEFNLGWYIVFQLYQHWKFFWKHTNVLASILQQNNRENDDRLRTSQDGNTFHKKSIVLIQIKLIAYFISSWFWDCESFKLLSCQDVSI